MTQILAVLVLLLTCIVGLWKHFGRIATEKRKQAEQARKDLDNANKPDGTPSDFLDAFGRMR
jgi:hypothetical protein